MLDDTMLVKAAYGNITDWTVRLTKGLVNENFRPKILSKIMPYVFNYAAGGFEFEAKLLDHADEQPEQERRW